MRRGQATWVGHDFPPLEKGGVGGICRPLRWLDPWINPPQPPFAKGGVPTGATALGSSAPNAIKAFAKGGTSASRLDANSALAKGSKAEGANLFHVIDVTHV
jgi:hypothetical protein